MTTEIPWRHQARLMIQGAIANGVITMWDVEVSTPAWHKWANEVLVPEMERVASKEERDEASALGIQSYLDRLDAVMDARGLSSIGWLRLPMNVQLTLLDEVLPSGVDRSYFAGVLTKVFSGEATE